MKPLLAAGIVALLTQPLQAQSLGYRAQHVSPSGPQVLAIYMGSTDCAPCVWPPLKAALQAAWPLLSTQAAGAGVAFATLGIAMDDDVEAGVARSWRSHRGAHV